MKERAALIETALANTVVAHQGPAAPLYESMRYSLLSGGKRLRPILALASCEAVGGRTGEAVGLACAIEMIHTYSMIHDDLPCMDDDDLRRGRPTNHKVYGEAIATLAGDGLLTDAFKVLARCANGSPNARAETVLQTVAELSDSAGSAGMVEGQAIDLLGEGNPMDLARLEYLHSKKTGALFMISVRGGARMGGANDGQLEDLSAYARAFGLAFQVVDDLLDVESSPEQMGKRTQKDQARGKATYPALLGVERSHQLARELIERAQHALAGFGAAAEPLRHLAAYVVERKL